MCLAVLSLAAFATTAQANLLDDGSFDNITTDTRTSGSAWTLTSNIAEPDGAIFSQSDWASRDSGGGGVWFKTFSGSNGSGNPPEDSLLTQDVVAPSDGDYTLSFWAAREVAHLATSSIASLSSSGTGGSDSVDLNTATFVSTANMSDPTMFTLSISGVTAGDTLTVSVEELGGTSNPNMGGESLMVDQFNLVAVPEPMSAALAGLGLLGLLGIRRRS